MRGVKEVKIRITNYETTIQLTTLYTKMEEVDLAIYLAKSFLNRDTLSLKNFSLRFHLLARIFFW